MLMPELRALHRKSIFGGSRRDYFWLVWTLLNQGGYVSYGDNSNPILASTEPTIATDGALAYTQVLLLNLAWLAHATNTNPFISPRMVSLRLFCYVNMASMPVATLH